MDGEWSWSFWRTRELLWPRQNRLRLWCRVEPSRPHSWSKFQGALDHHRLLDYLLLVTGNAVVGLRRTMEDFSPHICCLMFASNFQDLYRKTHLSERPHSEIIQPIIVTAWLNFSIYYANLGLFWHNQNLYSSTATISTLPPLLSFSPLFGCLFILLFFGRNWPKSARKLPSLPLRV